MSECLREDELIDAIGNGQWPEAVTPELRDHVARCSACSEVAVAVSAIAADKQSVSEVKLPSSSGVWWRMQIRLQQDARLAVTRKLQQAQTGVVAATIGFVMIALLATSILQSGWSVLTGALRGGSLLLFMTSVSPVLLLAAFVPLLLLAPVALYLVLAKE